MALMVATSCIASTKAVWAAAARAAPRSAGSWAAAAIAPPSVSSALSAASAGTPMGIESATARR